MGFQIKNKDGQALAINKIDEEVAAFWGIPVHPKNYASPIKEFVLPEGYKKEDDKGVLWKKHFDSIRDRITLNWFDQLGYIIHSRNVTTWEQLREIYIAPYKKLVEEYKDTEEYEDAKRVILEEGNSKKLMDLIDFWESKGYTPHPVKD